MNKIILFLPILIFITLFSYFSGPKVIYASKAVLVGLTQGKNTGSAAVKQAGPGKPRAFKLPDLSREISLNGMNNSSTGTFVEKGEEIRYVPWEGPKLVVIDPGHGGADPGAVIKGLSEKETNLDVAKRVEAILKEAGVLTLLTRRDDSFSEPRDRIAFANDKAAALFVSIHCNWFSDPSFRGTMTLYYPSKNIKAGYLNEIDFAHMMQKELMGRLETKDRGIIESPGLAVLRHAQMPSLLIELAFMSNRHDAALLASEDFKQRCAEGIAEGIKKALLSIDQQK